MAMAKLLRGAVRLRILMAARVVARVAFVVPRVVALVAALVVVGLKPKWAHARIECDGCVGAQKEQHCREWLRGEVAREFKQPYPPEIMDTYCTPCALTNERGDTIAEPLRGERSWVRYQV